MSSDETNNGRPPNGGASEPPAPAEPLPSEAGTIRNYQAERGFGFIARYGEPDVFFHVSDLLDRDIAIEIGQKVRFDLEPSRRNPGSFVAVRVRRDEK